MSRLQAIANQVTAMGTIVGLTGIFENIASLHIAQIKNQVVQSQQFFNNLWHIYTQLRVDNQFRFGRGEMPTKVVDKELFIVITAEGGLSGDIDQKLIDWMLTQYDPAKNDIIVVGHHGAVQLAQRNVSFVKYFKLPVQNQDINVAPLIKEVQRYRDTTVYYQTYVSLMVQDVKRIEVSKAVQAQIKPGERAEEIISEQTYIFEPSTFAVVNHLERSMLQIALSQVILESKLAQYASRFRAMSSANDKANEAQSDLRLVFRRAKRAVKDERLKEIVNGLRQAGIAK